jgi:hypothetical protein
MYQMMVFKTNRGAVMTGTSDSAISKHYRLIVVL